MSGPPRSPLLLSSGRLTLRAFQPDDAPDIFASITPGLTRFMSWEPPATPETFAAVWRTWLPAIAAGTDLHLVIRAGPSGEFLGLAGLHGIGDAAPELGIWIKEAAQRHGYGREAIETVMAWAAPRFEVRHFLWPVAEANLPSRHLAAALGGEIVGSAPHPKYTALLYRISAP